MLSNRYRLYQLILLHFIHINYRFELFFALLFDMANRFLVMFVCLVPPRVGNRPIRAALRAFLPDHLHILLGHAHLLGDTERLHGDLPIRIDEGPRGHLLRVVDGLDERIAPLALVIERPESLHPLTTPSVRLGNAG